jgi:hypothetical protein
VSSDSITGSLKRPIVVWAALALGVLLVIWRWALPERPVDDVGPRALADVAFALALIGLLSILGASLGRRVLRLVQFPLLGGADGIAIEMALGLGLIGSALLLLGLAGLYRPWAFAVLLLATWLVSLPELARAVHDAVQVPRKVASAAKREGFLSLGLTIGGIAILLMSAAQALTPPTDNDVLMYHLQAPFLYLQSGRIFLTPDIWQANGPLLAEMLSAIRLAFGSDTLPGRRLDVLDPSRLATFGASRDLETRLVGWRLASSWGYRSCPFREPPGSPTSPGRSIRFAAVVTTLRWTIGAGRHWLLLDGSSLVSP